MSTRTGSSLPSLKSLLSIPLILLVLFADPALCRRCPGKCICDDENLFVNCSSSSSSIPHLLHPGLKTLIFADNNIKDLKHSSIEIYANIELLDLSRNKFTTIEANDFTGLRQLRTLILRDNQLTTLGDKSLKGLDRLNSLDLSSNRISTISDSAFSSLSNLTELDLSDNDLTRITPLSMQGLKSLQVFKLRRNSLESIPVKAIDALKHLDHLDLSFNRIRTVSKESFISAKTLRTLIMAGGRIESIEEGAFVGLTFLSTLDLSDNFLKQVPSSALQDAPKLENLILDGNPIERISGECLRNVRSLSRFSLSASPELSYVAVDTFRDTPNLEIISLRHNIKLTYIDTTMLRSLIHLKELDLSWNNLETLEHGLVSWDRLSSVDIRGNPFYCNCSLEWLRQFLSSENKTTTPFINASRELRCAQPYVLKDQLLVNVEALSCSRSIQLSVLIPIALLLLTLAIVILLAFRYHSCIHQTFKCRFGSKTAAESKEPPEKTYVYEDESSFCQIATQRHPIRLVPMTELEHPHHSFQRGLDVSAFTTSRQHGPPFCYVFE